MWQMGSVSLSKTKNRMKKGLWIVIAMGLMTACKSSSSSVKSASSYDSYTEDLSGSLPTYPSFEEKVQSQQPAEPTTSPQAMDAQLTDLALAQYEKNKSEPYFNGYKVLVYSGLNREEAFQTQEEIQELFPELKADLQYQQPRYLVKVGRYAYKVEALKSFHLIRTEFPSARIIPDRIQRQEFSLPTQTNDAERQN